ncbi:MAG: SUMF1/EgtB/PvdO family nonheme iron enzyme [Pseudomonadota bacterium]
MKSAIALAFASSIAVSFFWFSSYGDPERGTSTSCGLKLDEMGQFTTIPAGSFVKSNSPVYPEEGNSIRVHVEAFEILQHEVTNRQFAKFVSETHYITDAEIDRNGGGSALFLESSTPADRRSWWQLSKDTTWMLPEGSNGPSYEELQDHPVVHVSLRDAKAYAKWAGGRIPYEVEWEYAASLGLPNPDRPDSGTFNDDGKPIANVWNGIFPIQNTADDGFAGTAPVGCFESSRINTFDMIGNVWEWTQTPFGGSPQFTIKGGSFLCSDSYCQRFRPAAREAQDADFSTQHIGFRIVKDVE